METLTEIEYPIVNYLGGKDYLSLMIGARDFFSLLDLGYSGPFSRGLITETFTYYCWRSKDYETCIISTHFRTYDKAISSIMTNSFVCYPPFNVLKLKQYFETHLGVALL